MNNASTRRIETIEALEAVYGTPAGAAVFKEIDYISGGYKKMIEKSPFVVLATIGSGGLDCSPRGDAPGFVRVLDRKTLLMPDRRGNNRLDSLRNLIEDSRASLLFLIPGVGETLRVNGHAEIIQDDTLQNSFTVDGKQPATVIKFTVSRIYFQCSKALIRSHLWNSEAQIKRTELPGNGEILKEIKADFNDEKYDREYPERLKKNLY